MCQNLGLNRQKHQCQPSKHLVMLTAGLCGNNTMVLTYIHWTTVQSKPHFIRGCSSNLAFIDFFFFQWSALTSWKSHITKPGQMKCRGWGLI